MLRNKDDYESQNFLSSLGKSFESVTKNVKQLKRMTQKYQLE